MNVEWKNKCSPAHVIHVAAWARHFTAIQVFFIIIKCIGFKQFKGFNFKRYEVSDPFKKHSCCSESSYI